MGFVYLATNENMPSLVKIGMTDGDVQARMDHLSNTSVAGRFVCRYYAEAENPGRVEREMHDLFNYCRVDRRREFFHADWLSVSVALVMMTNSEHEGRVRVLENLVRGIENQEDADEEPKEATPDEVATETQLDMEIRREHYKQYVAARVKNPKTVPGVYDNALSYLAEEFLKIENVYSITDAKEAQSIYARLLQGGDIHAQNIEYQNRAMSAAMRHYRNFLQQNK